MPLNITNADPLFQRALALLHAGQLQPAHVALMQVLKTNPNHVGALVNLATLARQTGQLQPAVSLFTRALALDPNNSQALNQLGETYRTIGVLPEALQCYDRALKLAPNQLELYNNRALVLLQMGRATNAIADWKHITDIIGDAAPDASQAGLSRLASAAFSNLGNAYMEQGFIADSQRAHELACQWDPSSAVMHSNLLRCSAFLSTADPVEARIAAENWWKRHASGIQPFSHTGPRDPDKPLKIGFISADFRTHSVAYFLLPLFEKFDRNRFQFYAYAIVLRPDEITQQFQKLATAWRNIITLPDPAVATQIKNDNIDILIDLAGHTADNRLRVFAYQPAPVQVAYLGYPGTTGSSAIAYRITDAIVDPPGMTELHFTEKLHRLARPAWCYNPQVTRSPDRPITRSSFTFGSFNAFAKVTPEVLAVWMQILQQVPGSRLILKSRSLADQALCQKITDQFTAAGIAADRLTLRGRLIAKEEHLAAYNDIDLALDTFPYNGTTTTCEALWMNVPVLTLAGNVHQSRVGASLLTALNLPELIATSHADYIAKAVRCAIQPEALTSIRTGLRQRLEQSPLMNAADFADEFTKALCQMWQDFCR